MLQDTETEIVKPYYIHVQGVSENMQQLFTSTKIGCKPGRIKVMHQIQAYNHTILLIIKSLCPKSPSVRGLVASLPVRLLFKSI